MYYRTEKYKKGTYIIHFLICFIVAFAVWAIILIYHGPFTSLRDYIVSTSMATNSNHIFATMFLSKNEINGILSYTDPKVTDAAENLQEVVIQKNNSAANNTASKDSSAAKISQSGKSNTTNQGITIKDVSGENFKGKIMIIDDPSRLTLGLAPKLGTVGAPLSEIVRSSGAIGGINAGGFLDDNLTGTGANPDGIVIQDGTAKFNQGSSGAYCVIGLTQDNILLASNHMTMNQLKNSNLRCAISFGPVLIANGQPLVQQGGASLQPRSAIGQCKNGSILLLEIDGRETDSKGVNFKTLQDILLQYGAYNAANLDGGSSTTMNYLGKTINNPCDITGERSIATAFLIIPAKRQN